jgi:hypothetical protein
MALYFLGRVLTYWADTTFAQKVARLLGGFLLGGERIGLGFGNINEILLAFGFLLKAFSDAYEAQRAQVTRQRPSTRATRRASIKMR